MGQSAAFEPDSFKLSFSCCSVSPNAGCTLVSFHRHHRRPFGRCWRALCGCMKYLAGVHRHDSPADLGDKQGRFGHRAIGGFEMRN